MNRDVRALIAVDAQLYRLRDGSVWAPSIYGYDFWERYLQVFESIVVAARIMDIEDEKIVEKYLRSDGEFVTFAALPFARGAKQYIFTWWDFMRAASKACNDVQCAIIRLPSIPASFVEYYVWKKKIPYVIEVVVDPRNAYPKGIIRTSLTYHLKMTVKRANGVSYVTQYALQQDYPCYARLHGVDSRHFESYYSTIVLKNDYFAKPRDYSEHSHLYKIVHVANNMNNDIKGHATLLRAVAKLRNRGDNVEVCFVGDGSKKSEFEQLAMELGIQEYIEFVGLLSSREAVRQKLINADLFVLPTKAEGLPRVIIEAMAVGLPCISTPVNGIPELLEKEYLVEATDVDALVEKIHDMIHSADKMNECSRRNIEKAREYADSELQKRRNCFYSKLTALVGKILENDYGND